MHVPENVARSTGTGAEKDQRFWQGRCKPDKVGVPSAMRLANAGPVCVPVFRTLITRIRPSYERHANLHCDRRPGRRRKDGDRTMKEK